jgi:hypothetical protein
MEDISNETRAERASVTLAAHKKALHETGESPEEDVIDLLADLRHYCHQNEIDFEAALQMSEIHFEEEK